MDKNIFSRFKSNRIRTKLIFPFLFMSVTIIIVNVFTSIVINDLVDKANTSYDSNRRLNEISVTVAETHTTLWEYMKTRGTQTLLDYYKNTEQLKTQIEALNQKTVNSGALLLEKDIYHMVETYLEATESAIAAKRAQNLEEISVRYKETETIYGYINDNIGILNKVQLQENSEKYLFFADELKWVTYFCAAVIIIVIVSSISLILWTIFQITRPIVKLSETANEISNGNYDVEPVIVNTSDEVNIMADAFNTMSANIKTHINSITEKAELEGRLKNQEIQNIKMKTALKDAQILSLQAQINPHFLFNTLNACAQLAMFEDAERTSVFVEKVADYYRYSIRKAGEQTTLSDEIINVQNYMYIMKIRLGDRITLLSNVDDTLLDVPMPSMILQPLVENAYIHGVDALEEGGIISLSVTDEPERVVIRVRDNGCGMTQETIDRLLRGEKKPSGAQRSGGIGFSNVLTRLRLFYGRDDVMDIRSAGPGQGTEAIVYIPKQMNKEGNRNV